MEKSDESEKKRCSKREEKIKELSLRRNEARLKLCQEVKAEEQRSKLPVNWENKRKRVEYEMKMEKAAEDAKKQGVDFERLENLKISVEQAEKMERKKKKKIIDQGWSDYRTSTENQYLRLSKTIKPDQTEYQKNKQAWGADFYCNSDNLTHGMHDAVSDEAVQRLKADICKQIEKRGHFSRRRRIYADADISYINESNRRFNEKANRYYSEYTQEIRESLERGTAL